MRDQKITHITDFKQYFLKEDNLVSLQNELIFSVLKRYNCFANCKICYTDKYFEKNKDTFQPFVPNITYDIHDKWLKIFRNYSSARVIDDLYWLKQDHPHLFNWYKDNASLFQFGALTDNSFIRSYDILMNDIDVCNGIYEIAFSDVFLSKTNSNRIITMLDKMHSKLPIILIKFIQTDVNSNLGEVFEWVKRSGIKYTLHHDILTMDTVILDDPNQQYSYASFAGEIYTVCGEADYLQYDSFFLTLIDAINPQSKPYATVNDWTIDNHLPKHLNGKKELYQRYSKKLERANIGITKHYRDYFNWISNNLIVNDSYNYIPSISLNPQNYYYEGLKNNGWTATQYGLLKPTEKIIPLFGFKE